MKKFLAVFALTLMSCPSSQAQKGGGWVGPSNGGGQGFAAPNAYGYAGSYTGGAGYAQNFGYNTMRPGNMPSIPYGYGYGNGYGAGGISPFGVPQPYGAGGGFYNINYGGRSVRFWQSPSGFYYPWVNGYTAPIAYVPTAGQSAQATAPPISTICSDLLAYLEQQKDKGNISDATYQHLKRRALDIRNKERDLRIASGGSVDSQDETSMRRDLEGLGTEVSKSISD